MISNEKLTKILHDMADEVTRHLAMFEEVRGFPSIAVVIAPKDGSRPLRLVVAIEPATAEPED